MASIHACFDSFTELDFQEMHIENRACAWARLVDLKEPSDHNSEASKG